MGIPWSRDRQSSTTIKVRVLKQQRHLCSIYFNSFLPLVATVNYDQAVPGDDWKSLRLEDNPELVRALNEGTCALVEHALASLSNLQGRTHLSVVQLLLDLPKTLYAVPEMRTIHDLLRVDLGAQAADLQLARLSRLHANYKRRYFRHMLSNLLKQRPILATAIEETLRTRIDNTQVVAANDPLVSALFGLFPVLFEADLLRTITGDKLSMQRLFKTIESQGSIRFIEPAAPSFGYREQEPPILRLDAHDLAALSAILPAKSLIESSGWLREWSARHLFEQRPQVETVAVAPEQALVRIELSDGHNLHGEMALRRVPPGNSDALLHFFKERRPITSISIGPFPLAMVAAIDIANLGADTDYTSVSGEDLTRTLAFCRKRVPALIDRLASEYSQLSLSLRPLARSWVLHLLRENLPRLGGLRNLARARRNKTVGPLLRIPIFETSGGELRSLDDLITDYRATKQFCYARRPIDGVDEVILVDADAETLLFKLFPRRTDMEQSMRLLVRRDELQKMASTLRLEPPPNTLQSKSLGDDEELRCNLWISADPDPLRPLASGIDFGYQGKFVERRELTLPLYVAGAITGTCIQVDDQWQHVDFERRYRRRLHRAARSLWRSMISEYRRGLARLTREGSKDAAQTSRLSLLRDALWIQLLALREALEHSSLNKSLRSLSAEISALDLLPLDNGRLISL
ncbi:MAG TPA: hypothetical protein ENK31_04765, partial [Nannocystis exedens]|nr:hypothetical protein [Nannocystis exedens]